MEPTQAGTHPEWYAIGPPDATTPYRFDPDLLRAQVPGELLVLQRWVCWRFELRHGKWTKVPYSPATGKHASTTKSNTWGSLKQALARYSVGGYDGVGFVLGAGYVGVDLDHSLGEDGKPVHWAQEILAQLNSYSEVTPSGRGMHIITRGVHPGGKHKRGDVEMYAEARFFTMSGRRWPDAPATIEQRDHQLAAVHAKYIADPEPTNSYVPVLGSNGKRPILTDREVIELASRARNGDKFRRLLMGDTAEYNGDDSAADEALAFLLAFYSSDHTQIERVISQSMLGQREKWQRRADYRERTIRRALDECREHYTGGEHRSGNGTSDNGEHKQQTRKTEQTNKTEKGGQLTLTALADLLAEPEPETDYVIGGILVEGGTSLLAAKPKVGKSTTARAMALSVAAGKPFLGREVSQGSVIYLALEEKRGMVQEHFAQMGATSEPIYVHIGAAPEEALEALRTAVTEYHPRLAIIDTIQRALRLRDLNDYAEVSRALEPWTSLARESGCHLLFTHHLGKGERSGGDQVLGSTALFAAVDTLLQMKRRESARTLETIQRYGDDLPETVIVLDPTTGQISAAGEVDTIKVEAACASVLMALGAETLSESDIRERVGGDQSLVGRAIRHMLDASDDRLTRTGEGKKGSPYLYTAATLTSGSKVEPSESQVSRLQSIDKPGNREIEQRSAASDEPPAPALPCDLCGSPEWRFNWQTQAFHCCVCGWTVVVETPSQIWLPPTSERSHG